MNKIDKQKQADQLRVEMKKILLLYRKMHKKYRQIVSEIATETYAQKALVDKEGL